MNHKPKFCFPVFFPKARPLLAWRCMGKGQEASRGVRLQGFGLALLGSHHPLPGHQAPDPARDTQLLAPVCPHPLPALSLTPSRS